MNSYQIIVADLDDTLADTKQPITERMADILSQVLDRYQLCIISGGKYLQLQTNVIAHLNVSPHKLAKIHLMSTSGAQYDRFNTDTKKWVTEYQKIMPRDQRELIATTIETTAKECGLWEEITEGKRIEDRMTQVTFSALGQNATPAAKHAWDPTSEKRRRLQESLAKTLPNYEVVINGTTSIDILQKGIDKAYGMRKLMNMTKTTPPELLFFGDSLYKDGNDYPVKEMGITSVAVTCWQETARYIESNLL